MGGAALVLPLVPPACHRRLAKLLERAVIFVLVQRQDVLLEPRARSSHVRRTGGARELHQVDPRVPLVETPTAAPRVCRRHRSPGQGRQRRGDRRPRLRGRDRRDRRIQGERRHARQREPVLLGLEAQALLELAHGLPELPPFLADGEGRLRLLRREPLGELPRALGHLTPDRRVGEMESARRRRLLAHLPDVGQPAGPLGLEDAVEQRLLGRREERGLTPERLQRGLFGHAADLALGRSFLKGRQRAREDIHDLRRRRRQALEDLLGLGENRLQRLVLARDLIELDLQDLVLRAQEVLLLLLQRPRRRGRRPGLARARRATAEGNAHGPISLLTITTGPSWRANPSVSMIACTHHARPRSVAATR